VGSGIRFARDQLLAHHPKLSHGKFCNAFAQAATALAGRAPTLIRSQVIGALARAIALIEDGHTQLGLAWGPENPVPSLSARPLSVQRWAVRSGCIAGPEAFCGRARVLAIGGVPIDEAVRRIAPMIHGDNEMNM
jgi:hypothetical protein